MMKRMKEFLLRLHRDERGAMAVEKVLLLALIALPIVIILFAFRKTIIGWFQNKAGTLDGDS
jgi:Flp pilus assembly pilin Flp